VDKNKRLLIQELKLLFLRTRKTNAYVFNSIICSTHPQLKNELHKREAKELCQECRLKMSDFRFKYIATLTMMAKTFISEE
jgi:hypothetical protein